MLGRNVRVGRSEIDLIVRDGRRLVAVEVKTRTSGDPSQRFDDDKVETVRRAMRRLDPPLTRLDLVTVELGEGLATVRWLRGAG